MTNLEKKINEKRKRRNFVQWDASIRNAKDLSNGYNERLVLHIWSVHMLV